MKKLLAIFLSVLMLCTMIPFATVFAAGEHYVELVADAEEAGIGDEIAIEVSLYGHESLGLTGALVELGYDHDVFELVTYYDEDEEMWLPQIEVGPKFSASSNKYIMFGPIDEETGESQNCVTQFLRATASATQAVKTNLFYTATFRVKEGAVSGDYTIDFINYNKKNIIMYGNQIADWTWEPVTITVIGDEPAGCEHEYEYDCSKVCSKCGEETRPEADHAYFYACDAHCMYCYELTNENAAHDLTHVDAVPATCTVNGNIEYWTCAACGGCWDNANATGMPLNRFSIIVPAPGHTYFDDCSAICDVCGEEREVSHNIIHVDAVPATCSTDGNIEYWYCDVCGAAWLDAECTLNTNLMSVVLPASCSYNAVHNDAVPATCTTDGNIEYWYCANCDVYYADAACAIVTNAKNIVLKASCSYNAVYTEAKAATCFEPGNTEYWYCANCDVYYADAACTIVTNAKNVIIPITHKLTHVEAKAATCTEKGNIEHWFCEDCGQAWLDEYCHLNTNLKAVVLPETHTYDNDYDAVCNNCGDIREALAPVITTVGTSVSDTSNNVNGLAFLFNADVDDLTMIEGSYKADYTNATVNGCVLKSMGAVVDNTFSTVDVKAAKLYKLNDDGSVSFVVRVLEIPEAYLDTPITATPYITYVDAAGTEITVSFDGCTASYNG